ATENADALPLRRDDAAQRLQGHPLGPGEPFGRLRGAPGGVERRARLRPGDFALDVRLPRREAPQPHREPARRPERLGRHAASPDVPRPRAGPRERWEDRRPQLRERRRDQPRRNFLGADLQQEGGALPRAQDRASARAARYSRAQPTARRRTRWMKPVLSVTLMAPRAS